MKSDEQIMAELERAAAGLMLLSEADYPFAVVRWEQLREVTVDDLRRLTGQPQALVVFEKIEDFFRPSITERAGQSATERQIVEKYRGLLRALSDNLEDLRVYKVGERNIPVFIVGRAPSGSWLGLSSRVIET